MLVVFAFKGHFTPEVKSVIHAMDAADLVVITWRMTSQLQILDVYSSFQGSIETPVF
jgi:hypothetical protein